MVSKMRILFDKRLSCVVTKTIGLMKPPLDGPVLDYGEFQLLEDQGFVWRPNGVVFDPRYGRCWLTIGVVEEINVMANAERAILVPFEASTSGRLNLADDLKNYSVELEPGLYKLLCEFRTLKREEIFSTGKYSTFAHYLESAEDRDEGFIEYPELCQMSFLPAQTVIEPEWLRFIPWDRYLSLGENDPKYRQLTPEELSAQELVMCEEPFRPFKIRR